jgi:hypothetical protein
MGRLLVRSPVPGRAPGVGSRERGMVHRDLKPEHVPHRDRHVKLLDFAIAKVEAAQREAACVVLRSTRPSGLATRVW